MDLIGRRDGKVLLAAENKIHVDSNTDVLFSATESGLTLSVSDGFLLIALLGSCVEGLLLCRYGFQFPYPTLHIIYYMIP